MSARGFFVVLEGPEGSGKSTLAAALGARMRACGLDLVTVREPGGTPAAELARQALLDPKWPVGAVSELLFYLAARADLVDKVIVPALHAGQVVLSDRFSLSTEAYQIAGRGLDREMVLATNRAATGGLQPDLTLVIDLDPEVGRARQVAAGKRLDRLDQESMEFHRRVAAYYLATKGQDVQHLVQHLDGTLLPERLLQAAWHELHRARPDIFGLEY